LINIIACSKIPHHDQTPQNPEGFGTKIINEFSDLAHRTQNTKTSDSNLGTETIKEFRDLTLWKPTSQTSDTNLGIQTHSL
jgi:hypothetical protein